MAVSKDKILNQVDTFLQKIQTSSYANTTNEQLTAEQKSGLTLLYDEISEVGPVKNRSLTGASPAILPMVVTTSDQTGKNRISFTLLINPGNVNNGRTFSMQSAYTRKGYVTQAWGNNQDLMTAAGKTAAFMVDGAGLVSLGRSRSLSFRNFMSLLLVYRNNGYRYYDNLLDNSKVQRLTRVIDTVQGVTITYDDQTVQGHFTNFTMDESAESPYIFSYSFEFVVSANTEEYKNMKGHYVNIPLVNQPLSSTALLNSVTTGGTPKGGAPEKDGG